MIGAEIIADSKNEFGNRITTFVLTFPRIILAELNTHRMFSRNSASSRAIPFEKMLKRVEDNPFIPIAFQKDHKGMQGDEYHNETHSMCVRNWLRARDSAVIQAGSLAYEDVTKQLCNRLLEPFMWHTAIVTATEYENFFHLRCPQYEWIDGLEKKYCRSWKDYVQVGFDIGFDEEALKAENSSIIDKLKINKGAGEIHIMALAEAMWDAMNESKPKELKAGEWHIPFGDRFDKGGINEKGCYGLAKIHSRMPRIDNFGGDWSSYDDKELQELKVKIATARCARVSYINYEGNDDYGADIKLHDRLVKMGHWSPLEHCARAMSEEDFDKSYQGTIDFYEVDKDFTAFLTAGKQYHGWSGNFRGFIQYRKTFDEENKK